LSLVIAAAMFIYDLSITIPSYFNRLNQ